MKDFNQNRFRDRNENRFEKRGFNNFNHPRSESRHEMFPAVCDNCGKECEVPFKPSGNKPVYCSDCFEKIGNNSKNNDRPFRSNDFNRHDNSRDEWGTNKRESQNSSANSNQDLKQQLDAINVKLNQILKALEPKANESKKVETKEVAVKKEKPVKKKTNTKAKKKAA